jgi:hypothetical protein
VVYLMSDQMYQNAKQSGVMQNETGERWIKGGKMSEIKLYEEMK